MSKLCSYLLQPLKYLLVYKSSLTFKYLIKLAMSRIMEPGNILFTCPLSRVLIFKHFSITLETFLQIEYSMKDPYIKQIKESSFSGEAGEGLWPCLFGLPLFLRLLLQILLPGLFPLTS